ncbi:carbohydrate ABC transporter permease [Nakamurella leprariae]|uniref:Carbohydrate ABC transporter permease n=1 Tax=Nakamurella leprariae TaxID=2803911 RepID=A0A938YAR3_9ACTN|nr:carbohydrate ABC transporter permease [Nakamurella leprariae]MBM9469035.1 carbohydrate ABC transporter permease [Nakamurella leprariae]
MTEPQTEPQTEPKTLPRPTGATPSTTRAPRGLSWKARRRGFTVLHRFLLVVAMIFFVAPFLWMLLYSLLPAELLQRRDPDLDLTRITFSEYGDLLTDSSFLKPMGTSALVALLTTLICLALGSFAAYGIARFRFRGRQPLLLAMMATQAIPVIVLAVPLFIIIRGMGLFDTPWALVIVYTATILPLVIWMMVGFFEAIPASLEKAARIDGCNRWQMLLRIAFPLAATGLAATGIFAFITAWSDFFLAKILTASGSTTLPVRTASFQGLFAMDYTAAATAGVITSLPVLVLTLAAQKWIVRGLTEGAVKG